MAKLSLKDANVLSTLFDPEASPAANQHIEDDAPPFPGVPADRHASLQKQLATILRPLNDVTPDPKDIQVAQAAICSLIDSHPGYAPAHVDRAQLLRLSIPLDALFTGPFTEPSRQIMQDLSRGITLASPPTPSSAVSRQQRALLASAHTHRGLLLLLVADMRRKGLSPSGVPRVRPGSLVDDNADDAEAEAVEDLASADFAAGARYGGTVARELSVRTNPYAKMCGAIVREAVREEMREAWEGRRGWGGR